MTRMAPDRRTVLVLATLVAGMTVASTLLLLLEPDPGAPGPGVTLSSLDQTQAVRPEDRLFSRETYRDWRSIIIHDSRTRAGSLDSLNADAQRRGRSAIGYQFVVNNGTGADDGEIEPSFRWFRQQDFGGDYLAGDDAAWFHDHAVGLCLVGDLGKQPPTDAQLRELTWLVQQLQQRFNIPADAVYVDVGPGGGTDDDHFPHERFRAQLVSSP